MSNWDVIVSDVYGVLLQDGQENRSLIGWFLSQKHEGTRLYLASNVDQKMGQKLWDTFGWQQTFENMFTSGALGISKPSQAFYLEVEKQITQDLPDITPDRILFIDDKYTNVSGAKAIGWQGETYTDWQAFNKKMIEI